MNIFDNDELFRVTKVDLNSFIDDGENFELFYDRFINNEPILNPLKAIFRFFSSDNRGNLFDGEDGSHFLLVISKDFLRKHKPKRVGIRTFIKDVFNTLENKISNFTKCTIITTGREDGKNTDVLESFLNLDRVKKSLNLDGNEAMIIEFTEFYYDAPSNNSLDIAIENNSKKIYLSGGKSAIIGDKDFYKIKSKNDNFLKFTYDGDEDRLLILPYGIDNIDSNNRYLQEEYLYDKDSSYDELDLPLDELEGYISFDGLKINLSLVEHQEVKDTNDSKPKVIKSAKHIIQNEQPSIQEVVAKPKEEKNYGLDLKKSFIVYLKSFTIPFSSNLTKVHYNLDLIDKKYILVGGNKNFTEEKTIAHIVVDTKDKSITIENKTNTTLFFQKSKGSLKMTSTPSSKGTDTDDIGVETDSIETDTPSGNQTNKIEIEPNDKKSFNINSVDFNDSSLEVDGFGVKSRYYNFFINSFEKGELFSLNRYSYKFFKHGTIVDNYSDLSYGGREYADGSYKVLGSTISRNPATIVIDNQNVIFKNSIKPDYTLTINSIKGKYEVSFDESKSISTHELFADTNIVAITKGNIKLLEVSIGINQ